MIDTRLITAVMLVPLMLAGDPAGAAGESAAGERQFVSLNIDRVVIETEGLTAASVRLADSIEQLALALRQLSTDSEALSEAERQALLDAVRGVEQASTALARLADALPGTAQQLGQQLPQVVENARQPIAELSSGLQSARDGIYAITESLPQATANAKALVDSALDSALVRISTYTVILIATLALALIAVFWFIYRQYLAPIAARLEPLAVAPGHFAELARHLKETSDNLLALQPKAGAAEVASTRRGDESAATGQHDQALPSQSNEEDGRSSE